MFEFKEERFKEEDWEPLFEMGEFLKISPEVNKRLGLRQIADLVVRHLTGDYGDNEALAKPNERAIKHGEDVISGYIVKGKLVMVATKGDRSCTRVF
ncbi:hypothetical protein HFZ78_13425 [Priestia megaterium]|uniref:Uncharacterized protein n=1 Tax=Priestia megaterium TaxID=1404 RepID=A0A6H1P260_PRIMG|nr:hypothetical protein [Priestia megaterium]QIZ07608.1 hypothetical protein HFZ78_13425 [Priestia megaterium]